MQDHFRLSFIQDCSLHTPEHITNAQSSHDLSGIFTVLPKLQNTSEFCCSYHPLSTWINVDMGFLCIDYWSPNSGFALLFMQRLHEREVSRGFVACCSVLQQLLASTSLSTFFQARLASVLGGMVVGKWVLFWRSWWCFLAAKGSINRFSYQDTQ